MKIRQQILFVLCSFLLVACTNTLEENKDINEGTKTTEVFFEAARAGDVEQLESVLEKNMNLDIQDDAGNTAVMLATMEEQTDAVEWFIDKGANLNIQNDRYDNVLLYAGAEGLLDIVKLAIEAGADTTLTNRYGGTALIPAADRGHVEVVEYLLSESDVDVDHMNNLHWTALLEAVILGDGGPDHQQIVQLLLEHGADPLIADGDGVTALEHAKQRGYLEIIELFNE